MHTFHKISASVSFVLLLIGHPAANAEEAADAPIKSSGVVNKVADAVRRGASAAATGIEKGAKAAANGVERGVKAAAHGVERGATATSNAAHRVAEKVGADEPPKTPASVPVTDR